MTDDPSESREWLDYAEHFRSNVLPKITDSAVVASIVPETPDAKACLESRIGESCYVKAGARSGSCGGISEPLRREMR